MVDFENYQSPFSWRYGSKEMRHIWSEKNKRLLWRQMWVALALAESEYDLVSKDQVDDLKNHATEINISESLRVEAEIHHDLMAELTVFSGQSPSGGGILHLGATSTDIEDNADVIRLRQSISLILDNLSLLLRSIADRIDQWADFPVMGFTHLQPAEPTTLGYRFAIYAQDLLEDWLSLASYFPLIRGKGFKGAVGTAAAFADLISVEKLSAFEARLSELIGVPFFEIASQVYPRKQDYTLLSMLAGIGATLHKFAFDLRFLQTPAIGEWAEPFGEHQIGSSAMPFKRNPIQAEKIDSLSRMLAQLPRVAWDNAANSMLERTLDDSANRRTILPEACLLIDEIILVSRKIIDHLQINSPAITANLTTYAPFAATERILMASVQAGANRQEMHEHLRRHALDAWEAVRKGLPNPLVDTLTKDELLTKLIPADKIISLTDVTAHIGNAPQKAHKLAGKIRDSLVESGNLALPNHYDSYHKGPVNTTR